MATNSPDPLRDAALGALTPEESAAVVRRCAAAREQALFAAERCAARARGSLSNFRRSSEVAESSDQSIRDLRLAIQAYTKLLRTERVPPETTLVQVKRLVEDARASLDDKDLIRRAAVAWAIEAYYSVV